MFPTFGSPSDRQTFILGLRGTVRASREGVGRFFLYIVDFGTTNAEFRRVAIRAVVDVPELAATAGALIVLFIAHRDVNVEIPRTLALCIVTGVLRERGG